MPTTLPALSSSGPPESPGWTPAFVSIRPVSCSELPCSSLATIDLLRPVTVPRADVRFPVPPAFPTARTTSPTAALEELTEIVFRFEAPCSRRTATSLVRS